MWPGVFANGQTCHQGASQDNTGYPGILSIFKEWCARADLPSGIILGILGYLVFKDRGARAALLSGDILG